MKTFAIILFALTYILMIVFQKYRPYIALAGGIIFIIAGIIPFDKLYETIDFNVLLMLGGTMGTVSFFIESKMPNRMADILLNKSPNVMWIAVFMSVFAGVISAFVDNVATLLMVAPVGLAIAKKIKISPVPLIISIAVSSNLQGAATLVGDTTSIMLGGYENMDFTDFFFMNGKPSIFFAVELGALVTVPVIMFIFRHDKAKVDKIKPTEVTNYVPTFLLLGTIITLIIASFIPNKPSVTNGLICVSYFFLGIITSYLRNKNFDIVKQAFSEIDFETILLLASLFIVIGSVTNAGVIDDLSNLFVKFGGDNLFRLYTLIVWGSVLISAFIDNIPYVATMLPVVSGIGAAMGIDPTVLYFGLLTGATLGGNITPIGASANIAGIGILRKEGYTVKNSDFFKIGIPFTLCAVTAGYLYCWFIWS